MPPQLELPEGCEVLFLSPLDIHFSQTRIRAEFQDNRLLSETISEIKVVPKVATDSDSDAPRDENGALQDYLLLDAPFPQIEVTKWRCKLRDADGTPKMDPDTGLDLYSEEEMWFTLDNRRLYCLQKAAVKLWPQKARCEVIALPQALARTRELRKFDTKTFGCQVYVGRRDDPDPESWCWRTHLGLPSKEQPEGGVARQRSARFRGARLGPRSGSEFDSRRRRPPPNSGEIGENDSFTEFIRSALLFLLVYLGLRLVVSSLRSAGILGQEGFFTLGPLLAPLFGSSPAPEQTSPPSPQLPASLKDIPLQLTAMATISWGGSSVGGWSAHPFSAFGEMPRQKR
eukprot:CAMPEP_0170601970 /NCGR_PEP_ID=MMETSP0224-20130122/18143_1 /TAXON_ID=285029 /ORGANISM="Togula jolla, Strain CCCM 725" /LENGTH=342 /DNA_ID=CAMNT_0010926781 /DNA_START=86 /DNA_END=1115 /DNA_ORIENTATION=-